jgi:hypothetical protein
MGNDPERLSSETHQGELAVDCLACPKVGVNLLEDWEKASPEERSVSFFLTFQPAADQ